MSRKNWLTYLLSLLCLFILSCGAVFAVGCVDEPKVGGVEVGTYYCDIDGKESVLELKEDCTFSLVLGDENGTGSYVLNENGFSFVFNTEMGGVITAEYRDDVITLHYNDSALTFLRKINYTVTFNAQGGTNSSAVVVNGRKVSVPAEPTRNGYLFLGWYQDADCKTAYDFDKPVSGNLTLYARWVELNTEGTEFTVSFDAGEGAENPQEMTTVSGKLYNLPTPQKDGAEFLGWWVSDYNDGAKLTYKYVDQTLYSDTTLFAVWGKGELGLSISSETISWNAIGANMSYELTIVPPEGNIEKQSIAGRTSYSYDFANKPAGNYTVTVSASNGKSVTGYFKNKALARISKFEVIDDSILVFNTVQNAEKYIVNVECGNKAHNHVSDNGSLNRYDFSSCTMQQGGIKFTVYAEAEGFATSEPAYYSFDKTLPTVTGLTVDEATGMIQWNAVENATSYLLTVEKDGETQTVELNGNTTSHSLKNYTAGEMAVSVSAVARGYNNSEIVSISYTKKNLPIVNNVHVFGSKLVWDSVDGAVGYVVKIGGETYNVQTNEFPLEKDYYVDGKAEVVIQTLGAVESEHSYDSDIVTVYLAVMGGAKYEAGELIWDFAVGVSRYEVQINDSEELITVAATSNRLKITLPTVGKNILKIRCVNEENEEASDWVTVEVTARSIKFDPAAGENKKPVTLYLAQNDPIVFPEFEVIGCTFVGWFTDAGEGGTEYKDTTFREDTNITLFAHWESNPYNAIFVVPEQEGEMADGNTAVVYYMQEFKLPVAISKDVTKTFAGWYDEPNGAGNAYTDATGKSTIVWVQSQDVTLYPKWINIFKFNEIDVKYEEVEVDGETERVKVDWNYSVSKGEGISLVNEITIPTSYNGKPVTTVEADGFASCSTLKIVNIPDTVTNVETGSQGGYAIGSAFKSCSYIEQVNVYEVEGNHQRKYMSIDGVLFEVAKNADDQIISQILRYYPYAREGEYVIPDGTTTLPQNVFASTKITKITIPASVSSISNSVFKSCYKLTEVVFEEAEAGKAASLTLGNCVFESCSYLTSVTFPAHLDSFGLGEDKGIFKGCTRLLEINVSANNKNYSSIDGVLFNKTGTVLYYMPKGTEGEYIVPFGVVEIAEYAFESCNKLTDVVIASSVTAIRQGAFRSCTQLSNLIFMGEEDDADLTIESYAFYNCNKIYEVRLPANLKTLQIHAFTFGSVTATKVTVYVDCVGDIEFETGAFSNDAGISNVGTLHLGAKVGVLDIPGVFGATYLANVTVDENNPNYTAVDNVLFNKDITRIVYYPNGKEGEYVIPETVRQIGDMVFKGKSNLTKITIPETVVSIGVEAFASCIKLAEIVFSQKDGQPLTIGTGAFRVCNSVKEIILPERVTEIGDSAFANCINLTTINIPSTVVKMGAYTKTGTGDNAVEVLESMSVFDSCTALATINVDPDCVSFASVFGVLYGKTKTDSGEYVITDLYLCPTKCSGNEGVVLIPSTVNKIWSKAFYGNAGVTKVAFDGETSGDVEFGDQVFYNTTNLEEVELPKGMTTLSTNLFYRCLALTSVEIPNTVTTIEYKAFNHCPLLSTVTFAKGGTAPLTFNGGSEIQYQDVGGGHYENVTVYIGMFYECDLITGIAFPQRTSVIGQYAFYKTNLEEIVFLSGDIENEDGTVQKNVANALTEIGSNAFYSTKITSVSFPKNLSKINMYAFNSCKQLEEVKFALDGVLTEIGTSAFGSCGKIDEIVIPKSVTTIGNNAFISNAITKLEFAKDSVLTTIGDSAFNGAAFASVEIPASVQTIGSSAFSGNKNLTSVTFENRGEEGIEKYQIETQLNKIGNSAFAATSITEFAFPTNTSSTITLGTTLFSNCKSLRDIYLSKSIGGGVDQALNKTPNLKRVIVDPESVNYKADEKLPILYNAAGASVLFIFGELDAAGALTEGKFIVPFGATEIGANAFQHQVGMKEIFISKTVQSIGANAFLDCYNLEKVTFEEGSALTSIGASAFANCISLKEITIPNGVTKLLAYTFMNCSSLETINLPSSLTRINDKDSSSLGNAYTFKGCTSLESISLPASLEVIGKYIFDECINLTSVTLEDGIQTVGGYMLRHSPVTSITIPASVTTLSDYAFNASKLESITFAPGSTLTKIGSSAFSGCTELTSIVIPDSVTTIGASAFSGCSSLSSITMSTAVKKLDNYTFQTCTSLTDVSFPYIETLGNSVFAKSSVTSVNLPAAVTFGTSVFDSCTELRSVTFGGSALTALNDKLFLNCTSLEEIDLSNTGITYLGKNTFQNSGLTSIKLPNTLVNIGSSKTSATLSGATYVFQNCTRLESVTFGTGLAKIGAYTFDGCTALKEISFPASLSLIGNYAFRNTGLTSVDVSMVSAANSLGTYLFAGCTSLSSVKLSDDLTKLSNYMFDGCVALDSITLPSKLTDIATYAFRNSGLTSVSIPAGVKTIGNYTFNGCSSLTSVTFAEGLTTIGTNAFEQCNKLTGVVFPSTLTTINNVAFWNTSITSINIPAKVTTIGTQTFGYCRKLTAFTVDDGNGTFTAIDGALYKKDGTLVSYPCGVTGDVTLSAETTAIVDYALSGSLLNSVVLPESLETIGRYLFRVSAITSVTLPSSLTSIPAYMFQDAKNVETVIVKGTVTEIGNYAFDGCTALKNISFQDGLETIGNYAFRNSGLENFKLPDSVTSIGTYVFNGCATLETITFGESSRLETIGNYAFQNSGLTSITLPDSVVTLGNYVFTGSSDLAKVAFGEFSKLKTMGNYVFQKTALKSIALPASLETVGTYAFQGSELLETVDLSETKLTVLNANFFESCIGLKSVTFPKTLQTLGNNVFKSSGLETIVLPDSITSLGNNLFESCVSLTSVTLPNSVTALGNYMFKGCTELKTIDLPETLTFLGTYTFQNSGLETIVLPDGIVHLGATANTAATATASNYAFAGCENLTQVTLPNNLLTMGGYIFQNCINLQSIELPQSLTVIGRNAFDGSGIKNVDASGVETIGQYAFANMQSLETVTLGNKLVTIAGYLFMNSTIGSLTIPDSVTKIETQAFAGCQNLKELVLSSALEEIAYKTFMDCTLPSVVIPEGAKVNWGAFTNWTAEQTIYIMESQYTVEGYWMTASGTSYTTYWFMDCTAKIVFNYDPDAAV